MRCWVTVRQDSLSLQKTIKPSQSSEHSSLAADRKPPVTQHSEKADQMTRTGRADVLHILCRHIAEQLSQVAPVRFNGVRSQPFFYGDVGKEGVNLRIS